VGYQRLAAGVPPLLIHAAGLPIERTPGSPATPATEMTPRLVAEVLINQEAACHDEFRHRNKPRRHAT